MAFNNTSFSLMKRITTYMYVLTVNTTKKSLQIKCTIFLTELFYPALVSICLSVSRITRKVVDEFG